MPEYGCLGYTAAKLPLPRRSEVSHSKTGALKVLIFWSIDGPEFRGIKRKQFRGKGGDSEEIFGRHTEHKGKADFGPF